MQNRLFFPQAALDRWLVDGQVDLQQGELTLLDGFDGALMDPAERGARGGSQGFLAGGLVEGRRYALVEAVHIVREVSGAGDSNELVGRVKPLEHLVRLGAEVVESSMILGEAAYDVVPGWLGLPSPSSPGARSGLQPSR